VLEFLEELQWEAFNPKLSIDLENFQEPKINRQFQASTPYFSQQFHLHDICETKS
jgi:hypothetical protein